MQSLCISIDVDDYVLAAVGLVISRPALRQRGSIDNNRRTALRQRGYIDCRATNGTPGRAAGNTTYAGRRHGPADSRLCITNDYPTEGSAEVPAINRKAGRDHGKPYCDCPNLCSNFHHLAPSGMISPNALTGIVSSFLAPFGAVKRNCLASIFGLMSQSR